MFSSLLWFPCAPPQANPPLILGSHLSAALGCSSSSCVLAAPHLPLAGSLCALSLKLYALCPSPFLQKALICLCILAPTILHSDLCTCHRGLNQEQVFSVTGMRCVGATQIPASGLGEVVYFQNRWRASSEWQGGPHSRQSCSRHPQLGLPRVWLTLWPTWQSQWLGRCALIEVPSL